MKQKNCVITRAFGYTLIEIVFTIAVFAIMVTVAIPTFNRWLPDYKLRVATRDFLSDMKLAKFAAVKQNSNCSVTVASDKYTIAVGAATLKTVFFGDYGGGVCLNAVSASPIIFLPTGMINSGADQSISLKNSENKISNIAITSTGIIKLNP